MMIHKKTFALISICWLLMGCVANASEASPAAAKPKPTVVPLIGSGDRSNAPQLSSLWSPTATSGTQAAQLRLNQNTLSPQSVDNILTPTPSPTPLPSPTTIPEISSEASVVEAEETVITTIDAHEEVVIYDDELDPNWTLEYSENVDFDPLSTTRWFEMMQDETGLNSGAVSLSVTPKNEWNKLYLTLHADSSVAYHRDQVQAVSLWFNTGNNYLSSDALVVAFVGSNEETYWFPNDKSVLTRETSYYPEIPLYDLGVNVNSLPPNTWINATLWMDQVRFGPEYIHVTGIYIANKHTLQSAFYIDKVALLLATQ